MTVEERWLDSLDPEVMFRRRMRMGLIAGAILVFAMAGVVAYLLIPKQRPADQVLIAAQHAVQAQMLVRGTPFFSPPSVTQVTALSANQFQVRGWVQDVTPDGKLWNYLYSATVDYDPMHARYNVYDVAVVEQY
jgi:hypothetical protein